MKVRCLTLMVSCLCIIQVTAWGAPDEKVMSEAYSLREQGEFEKATRLLQSWLDQNTTSAEENDKRTVEFEIERIRRIRQDYRLTRERLISQLQDRLTTFTEAELDDYEREGKLDVQLIDGQKLYVNSSASNLILRAPELRSRRKDKQKDSSYRRLYEQMLTANKAEEMTSLSLVTPQDFLVTYTIVVNPNAASDGQTIRCWMPFVNHLPSHSDVGILEASPQILAVAPPEYPHRTVYFEQAAKKDQPVTFTLSFVYRSWSQVSDLDPKLTREYDKNGPEYQFYTAERKPHIDFTTEELQRISHEVSAGDQNPLLQARRIYDWIARNTIYQYAREYSTLDNISQYTAARRAGDCGQHGMLFIALCRMKGIPARWVSGWESFNHRGYNMHDWCEFYVKPWGWLPADPDMAVNILNYSDDELTTGQQEELAGWLFGNLDHYRLTINTDYGRSLYPEKTDFRSETVDFQRGEVEAAGKNLYFDQWEYKMQIKPISSDHAGDLRQKLQPPPQQMPTPTPTPTPAPTPIPSPSAEPEPSAKDHATTPVAEAETTATKKAPVEQKPSEKLEPGHEIEKTTASQVAKQDTSTTPTKEPTKVEQKTSGSVEAKPAIEATPAPTPKPEPVQTPKPELTPTPKPEPTPTPKPTPDPTPAPKPESTPNPKPDLTPTPKPDPTPTPEPKPEPSPLPKSEPTPTPEPTPAQETKDKPQPEATDVETTKSAS